MGNSDLVGVVSKQQFFVQMKLGRMRFNGASRLVDQWEIETGVLINPAINFGKPAIQSSGVSTLIVANQYKANKSDAALVARLWGISESGVINAVNFEKGLQKSAA
jgi:uncharacterized protein (DUF433 family)